MRVAAVRLSDTGYRWLTFDEPVPMRAVGNIVKRQARSKPRRVNWRAIDAMTEARRKLPVDKIESVVQEWVDTDVTQREIAERYGMTSAGVGWAIRDHSPDAAERRRERQQRDLLDVLWVRLWARCQRAVDEDRRCKTCGGWILRNATTSCSSECADAYKTLRDVDDPDYHRRAMAKVYLRSPEKYPDSCLEWAYRMLSDNPPPRNRTYLIPGSKRAEIVKKYRPEAYEELVAS